LAGYRQALIDHGIEFDNRLILRTPASREGGTQLLRRLMTMSERPTAVFLTDPMAAVGLLSEARKTGVNVPEDLSVVGFDDSEIRYSVYPELTAVCQDAETLGREAFNALRSILEREDGAGAPRPPQIRIALRTWLEVHNSTCPVRP
jgi:LacI family transcriptional regulator